MADAVNPRNGTVSHSPGLAGSAGAVVPQKVRAAQAAGQDGGKRARPGSRPIRARRAPVTDAEKATAARIKELREREKIAGFATTVKVDIQRIRVSPDCYEGLVELAEARGLRVSQACVQAIEAGLEALARPVLANSPYGYLEPGFAPPGAQMGYQDVVASLPPAGRLQAGSYGEMVRADVDANRGKYAGWLPASPAPFTPPPPAVPPTHPLQRVPVPEAHPLANVVAALGEPTELGLALAAAESVDG